MPSQKNQAKQATIPYQKIMVQNMSVVIQKDKDIDVMLIGEGTYPYIRGGVSSWIHQLINGMPDLNFGIVFVGASPEDYGDIRYELPENMVYLEVHYLFETRPPSQQTAKEDTDEFESIRQLYDGFRSGGSDLPPHMKNLSFFSEVITHEHFLHARQSWDFIAEKYLENCPDLSFIDYFWTVKNIHKPIWILANISANLPPYKIIHAPSTGYAGMIGVFGSYHTDKPLILTEHGIYTRERMIDMLTADWIDFKKPALMQESSGMNYIKKMWVNFFEKVGQITYHRADPILSLFSAARDIQVNFGADRSKTMVIPNGVDVDGLHQSYLKRAEKVPRVITLIGRVVSIKDIKTFIRAIRIAVNEMDDIQAWVVGPLDEDVEYAEECRRMVEVLNLEEHFFFKGFQNIKDILPLTGLLTLTSISEGMPLTILEGYAAGVPCVATDVGSCRDLIYGGLGEEDEAIGAAGEVTGIADPVALAQSYVRFLSDDELWHQAQKAALTRVQTYYRQDTFLASYREIYDKAMS